MNSKMWLRRAPALVTAILAGSSLLGAADSDEISNLKAALAAQQKQIEMLQQSINRLTAATAPAQPANLGNVASLTPVIPAPAPAPTMAIPAIPGPQAAAAPAGGNPCEAPLDTASAPAYLRLGGVCIAPVGFMDLTGVWRNEATGSGIGTNFASIPYNNAVTGRLSEFRFSMQNSRLGFRADGNWMGAHFIGYNEFDFLGTSGGNNLGVTNGAVVPRARLYWVDITKGKIEFLAGQSWSLLTPGRTGISPLPGNLFYSQVMDVNYLTGLTWTRQPGLRVVYHPSKTMAFAFAVEQPNQYIGGSSGAPAITLPSALAALAGTQFDNGSNFLTTPNLAPDFIAKIAMDPNSKVHVELAGLERTFKDWNPNTNLYFTKVGGGVSLNANLEVVKNIRLISNNYWSDGGGRYLFGQAPDVIIRSDGSISPIHAGGFNEGFEAREGKTLIFGYWGGTYVGRDVSLDANGTTLIGYGFHGASNSNNRMIQEVTFGFNQTFWSNPRYGAINFIGQYQYTMRSPWYWTTGVAGGKDAKDDAIYFDVRYTLPGASPSFN